MKNAFQSTNVTARYCYSIKLTLSKVIPQSANLLDIALNDLSPFEEVGRIAGEHGHSRRCSRHHKSTRWNSGTLAEEADQVIYAKDHVGRVGALHNLSIPPCLYLQILGITNQHWRDELRSNRTESIKVLCVAELSTRIIGCLPLPR